MEALDIMRLVPSFHESSSPAFNSCDTRAELTPSIRAASTAVTAGMSPSSRLTATDTMTQSEGTKKIGAPARDRGSGLRQ